MIFIKNTYRIKEKGECIVMNEKRQITVRMDSKTYEKVETISLKEKRSISMQIEYMIEKYIEWYENDIEAIEPNRN